MSYTDKLLAAKARGDKAALVELLKNDKLQEEMHAESMAAIVQLAQALYGPKSGDNGKLKERKQETKEDATESKEDAKEQRNE